MKSTRYIHVFFPVLILVAVILCSLSGCSTISTIPLNVDDTQFNLIYLNKTAKNGEITKPIKSSYLYYGFSDEFLTLLNSTDFETAPAIEVTLSVVDFTDAVALSAAENGTTTVIPAFAFGLLYENDFEKKTKLKTNLDDRPLVRGRLTDFSGTTFTVSLAMDLERLQDIRGFTIYATAPVKLDKASIKQARLGWIIPERWYGFGASGGTLLFTEYNRVDFSDGEKLFVGSIPPKISVGLVKVDSIGSYAYQNRVKLAVGNENAQTVSIRRAKNQTSVSLYASALQSAYNPIYLTENAQMVDALVMQDVFTETVFPNNESSDLLSRSQDVQNGRVLTPIPCDPGLILGWNQNTWRTKDYELYCWEQFPSILLFDVVDLKILDSFFKRLAFFAEKKGFRGRLLTDEEMADMHGYNAHDYSAEGLASFFDLAASEAFPLNEYELLLRDILVYNGVILQTNGRYTPGMGAVVSMSRQSPYYNRVTFTSHENFHGIYFIDSDFRSFVSQVYSESDEKSVAFLMEYFTKTPTLNYDIDYTLLRENEFMGYLMQQSLSRVADYFAKNLALRGSVNKDFPELAKYVRDTNGQGFYDAAYKLSNYLFERFGLAAGRSNLVSIE